MNQILEKYNQQQTLKVVILNIIIGKKKVTNNFISNLMQHYSNGSDSVKTDEEFLKNKEKVHVLSKLVPHDLYMFMKEKKVF